MQRISRSGILKAVTGSHDFDVLVIGSGASGLAAAVSAERAGARVGLATKGSIQACNSAKAQGGIQAAFGEDDSPEQHAADVFKSSHESADMSLVEILTGDAQSAIRVTSPVAFGWFVESSPRSCATLKQRPPAARTTVAASSSCSPHVACQPFERCSSAVRGLFAKSVPLPASNASRSPFVIACPVRSPTWSRRLALAPPQRARR